MNNQTVKALSQGVFALGAASVIGSAIVFLRGMISGKSDRRHTGLFLGLWAPTLFTISEMLDRMSIQDDRYMGIAIRSSRGERAEEAVGAR